MQLATAELDPTLDPFSVAGSFVMRGLMGRMRSSIDPKRLFYEAQKVKVRFARLIEAVERLSGSRPGPKLTVNFRGTEGLETTIRRAARRLTLGLTAAAGLIATAMTATAGKVAGWVPVTLGVLTAVLALGLVVDLVRRRG
jgi:hypothetical protein